MEAEFLRRKDQTDVAGMSSDELKKKGLQWDLNDWTWDGNLFLATPSNAAPAGCGNRELGQVQGEIDPGVAEKRRRVSPADDREECNDVANREHGDTVADTERNSEEERPRKGVCSSAPPRCQVDGCQVDLSNRRDYHKRHKVCEMHSRASVVLLKSVEHRFCQQCSRFHLLQEFDEGKKSCRQRLAKHNGRRRKPQPQAICTGDSLIANQSLSHTLLLLLKQLSGLESANSSEQTNGPNYLVNLLKNLATLAGTQASREMQRNANSAEMPSEPGNEVANEFTTEEPTIPSIPVGIESSAGVPLGQACLSVGQAHTTTDRECATFGQISTPSSKGNNVCTVQHVLPEEPPAKRCLKDFDLNAAYVEEDESRTDRIVFKIFGKGPDDFPVDLRAQILNWLSHYPSDMESYIRPGCVILTVYLRLPNWMWDELGNNLTPWIEKLVGMSTDGFWRTGWVYARLLDCVTLICNGGIELVSPWQPRIGDSHQILCVTPIAVSSSSTTNFSVKGFNLAQPTTKLLCLFGGKYLLQEATQQLVDDTSAKLGPQCLTFSCSFPNASGRGFIEVEDYDKSSLSYPFVVTEEDVCSEIRTLEHELNAISCVDTSEGKEDLVDSHNQKLNFLQEIGWLLQRSHTLVTCEAQQACTEGFPVSRFRWLLSFAVNREWCAVVKKLLDTLFKGIIDLDACSPVEFALREDLVYTAVHKRSKPLVQFLLRYTTNVAPVNTGVTAPVQFLFTPDITGPSNVTPLHIAATISDAAGVLDALTDDPRQLGIKAWKNARDTTGFTPEDYARKRGHVSYIQMVQNKIDSRIPKSHVSLTIPSSPLISDIAEMHTDRLKATKQTALPVEKIQLRIEQQPYCRQCAQQVAYHHPRVNRFLSTRPAVLSMIAIAVVCVCAGLIMKSPPDVGITKCPFLWDSLLSGSI